MGLKLPFLLVLFFAATSLFQVSFGQKGKLNSTAAYYSFLSEKNCLKLPNAVLSITSSGNKQHLKNCLNKVDKLLQRSSLSDCEYLSLLVTKSRILAALNKFKESIALNKKIEPKLNTYSCDNIKPQHIFSDLGASYNYTGKNEKALRYYYKSLRLSKKDKDSVTEIVVNVNIGNIYYTLGKYQAANYYFRQALKLSNTNPKYLSNRANAYDALGNLYLNTANDMTKAKQYFEKALVDFKQLNLAKNYYTVLNNLGIAYEIEGNNDQALLYYNQVYAYAKSENDELMLGNVSYDLALNYRSMGNSKKAVDYFNQTFAYYAKLGYIEGLRNVSFELRKLYEAEKDYQNAYLQLQTFTTYSDSLKKSSNLEELVALKKDYQFGLEREQLNGKVLSYRLRNTILLVSIVFILLSIGLIALYRKRLAMKKAAKIQEQFTFQLLQNTEEERSRIANELHDSVNHELLTIKNALVHGKSIDIEQVAGLIEEVRTISRNLHPAVLETIGLEASIEQLCERLTENGLFTTCEIDYEQPLDKNTELQLYRIVQESLNNTLKHGKANAAKVDIIQTANTISVSIKDNGQGFKVEEQLNSPRSFGLQSLLQRAKSIAGNLTITSSEKGTLVQFNKAL